MKLIKKATLKEERMKRGEVGISSNMTVKRWANEWLETYRKPNNSPATYKNNQRFVNNFILPTVKSLKLTDVKDIHLQKALNEMVGYSEDYIKKTTALMKAMFSQARISKLIVYDPAENLVSPKGEPPQSRRSLTELERKHLLKVAETHAYGLMVKMFLYTGMRPGELRALTWNHIDLKAKYIYIRQAVAADTENIKEPKSKAGIRDITIVDALYDDLVSAKNNALLNGTSPFDFVFLQVKGNVRHTKSSFGKARKSFFKAMDVSMGAKYERRKAKDGKMRLTCTLSVIDPDLDFYYLRHTYCTDLQRAGVPINIAKYLMGHSKIELTEAIYTHMTDDVLEQARLLQNKNNNVNNDVKLINWDKTENKNIVQT